MSKLREDIVGWFEGAGATPAHDPGVEGTPCIVCMQLLRPKPVVTICLHPLGTTKSLFFRAHKECWNSSSDHDKHALESSAVDALFDHPIARAAAPDAKSAGALEADGTTLSRLADVAAATARGLRSQGKAALPAAPSAPNGPASAAPDARGAAGERDA